MFRFRFVRFVIGGYLCFIFLLFLYSFTQIDLSLTLSQASFFQTVQQAFQYIGYFNRPLSAQIFFFLIIGLFIFYTLILECIKKQRLTQKQVLVTVCIATMLLTVSYNAFSYDLFNYIFDAKIFTAYGENPYLKKALDFPNDPMLSFMRWTHRTYPYGPLWLGISVPISFLGMQVFTLTFGLFKLLMAISFLGTVYFLYKILKEVKPDQALLGTAFFALSPLVLIESVLSAHNDIVMMMVAMVAVYFLVKKKFLPAFVLLILSISIKFATIFLLPVFLIVWYMARTGKKINWDSMFGWMLILSICAVVAASIRTNFQPWYLLYILPISALLADRKYIASPVTLISVTALFNYVPFLYTGNWDPPIPQILNNLNIASVITAVILFLILFKLQKKKTV